MALEFAQPCARLFLGRGILAAGINAAHALTIYSGAKPSAADFVTNWAASYTSAAAAFLAHYEGAVWTQSTYLLSMTTVPAAVNASHTGTGAWVCLWMANPALASMGGAIPTSSFLLGDVSDANGDGIVRFSSLSFVAAASKAILDGSIGAVM
jgi:hypothetical protein